MSPKSIDCRESIVKTGDLHPLESLLADGIVFESPMAYTPQVGRRLAKTYLERKLCLEDGVFPDAGDVLHGKDFEPWP